MYEQYFGLRERPFDLSPNPRFLFLSSGHREALTHLRYGLRGRPGLTVITGEVGTGKTTLVRAALQPGDQRGPTVVLSNPTLTRSEFFEFLASGFGFGSDAATSKTRFLHDLESAMTSHAAQDAVMALIVDEAQSLPYELLEEIRLLTNIETPTGRSLAVALVGQPELATRLNGAELRQLKQRIALRCELAPLDLRETAAYIAGRVRVAGGNAEALFTREAVVTIHENAKGIPRTISVICDNALVNGFAMDRKPVGRDIILEVCHDFGLGGAQQSTGAAVAVDQKSTPVPPDERGPEPVSPRGRSQGPAPAVDSTPASRSGRLRRFSFF